MVTTEQIHAFLYRCGIRPHLEGFRLLTKALELVLCDEAYLYALTRKLYVDVGLCFQLPPTAVERAMRYAIHMDCSLPQHQRELGFPPRYETGVYTVGEFLSGAYLRLAQLDCENSKAT